MIAEDEVGMKFNVAYHYEAKLHADVGKNRPCLMKRLGQEAVSLATSLPLSFKSSVFVRCDTDRLVVMKVKLVSNWVAARLTGASRTNKFSSIHNSGFDHRPRRDTLCQWLLRIRCVLSTQLSADADAYQLSNDRTSFDSFQSESI